MPHWEGIEDSSASPAKVWLGRRKRPEEPKPVKTTKDTVVDNNDSRSTSPKPPAETPEDRIWKPLRKCDCQALNAAEHNKTVFIEGGRATADPVSNLIFFNFFRGYQRELCSAWWFIREEKSAKEFILTPIAHRQDLEKIEVLYQKAVSATSSLGKGIGSVLNDEVTLNDNSKVKIRQTGGTLTMQRTPPGWFSSTMMLQRGYGEYTVDGEEEETCLGPVRHVVFVVHGIGEAMFARDDISLPSLIEQMNITRTAVQKRQVKEWKRLCDKARKDLKPLPPPPNRIEFLPIEWFSRLHDSSSELMRTLKAVSLPSIPALRSIANDIIFDVLLYLTPAFCQAVIETVTDQIIDLYRSFQKVHPDFLNSGGECSLIGHSLGTVILWDILSILKEKEGKNDSKFSGVTFGDTENVGYHAYAQKEHANEPRYGTWGPSLTTQIQQTLPFTPKATIFLGSPLGMFLTLRGAHPVFESMWTQAVTQAREAASHGMGHVEPDVNLPTSSPFSLPTGSLYNIFNPSDPVAYRIEPLLLPQTTKPGDIPPPAYLTAPGKDVRLHVKAMQFGDEIRRSMVDQKGVNFSALAFSAVSMLSSSHHAEGDPESSTGAGGDHYHNKEGVMAFPLGGKSYRVDYSFQPAVIDNEYISAVLAHSTSGYFLHEDFVDFMIDQFAAAAAPPSSSSRSGRS